MDRLDRKILNRIQNRFPLISEPYQELAKELGLSKEEILERIVGLKEDGTIRRIGAIFDSKRLGFKSTLIAIKVPKERVDEVVEIINSYIGVTHNYLREHEYNIWFTLIAETEERIKEIINEISSKTGIDDILNLPAKNVFKLKVAFEF